MAHVVSPDGWVSAQVLELPPVPDFTPPVAELLPPLDVTVPLVLPLARLPPPEAGVPPPLTAEPPTPPLPLPFPPASPLLEQAWMMPTLGSQIAPMSIASSLPCGSAPSAFASAAVDRVVTPP